MIVNSHLDKVTTKQVYKGISSCVLSPWFVCLLPYLLIRFFSHDLHFHTPFSFLSPFFASFIAVSTSLSPCFLHYFLLFLSSSFIPLTPSLPSTSTLPPSFLLILPICHIVPLPSWLLSLLPFFPHRLFSLPISLLPRTPFLPFTSPFISISFPSTSSHLPHSLYLSCLSLLSSPHRSISLSLSLPSNPQHPIITSRRTLIPHWGAGCTHSSVCGGVSWGRVGGGGAEWMSHEREWRHTRSSVMQYPPSLLISVLSSSYRQWVCFSLA